MFETLWRNGKKSIPKYVFGYQSQLFEKWLYGLLVSKIFGGKMKMTGFENFGKNRLIICCPTGCRRSIDGKNRTYQKNFRASLVRLEVFYPSENFIEQSSHDAGLKKNP